jgi:putative flavoprotein involved in K+ transport
MSTQQAATAYDRGVRAFRHDSPGSTERFDTIVVGGGQAGLAAGYHLARRGIDFAILDENENVGDNWQNAWDSLRLFTPARYNGLPGMPFPLDRHAFATRDEMSAYLRAYAERFDLPVRQGVHVDRLSRGDDGYAVTAGPNRYEAANVVVATGPQHLPRIPDFAGELAPGVLQLHSSAYRNPGQLQPGPALVVGASHSGPDIALEIAPSHPTVLSGPFRGEIPFDIEGRPARTIVRVLWFVANHVLTVKTPLGRKARPEVRAHGGPLIRVKRAHLEAAGVRRETARTVGVENGRPVLETGEVLDVANVIWCTGFRLDFGWMDVPLPLGDDGYPVEEAGAVPATPGLYFVGLPFQRSFASMLIGGVGRDAEAVATRIAATARAAR